MLRFAPALLFLLLTVLLAAGCSGSGNPVSPVTPDEEFNLPIYGDTNPENHSLLGSWTMNFNPEDYSVEITPDRENAAHMNITGFIPTPGIVINSYNPTTNILNVNLTISNPFGITGYDIRLIIYTDAVGHKLTNADDWTALYDIPGGLPINPFKAYAKTEPGRVFAGYSQHTENLNIHCPGGNFAVQFAVDASYPTNCTEPYEISSFYQGILEEGTGETTDISVTVKDWQNNVSYVSLYCPSIIGGTPLPFLQNGATNWEATLTNNNGVGQGEYVGYLLATSHDGGSVTLYDEVKIMVSKGAAIDPITNLAIRVNRMPANNAINAAAPWTLTWSLVPGAQEYAIYYDTEPTNPNYFFLVATVGGTTTLYNVPTDHYPPNHLVRGYTYTVRARAVAGDPSSESFDSNYAFIKVSAFDTLANRTTLNNNQLNREGWTTAVERYPYATSTEIAYWPYAGNLNIISSPNSLSLIPTYLGDNWTVGTGNLSDNYPGKLVAITTETPRFDTATVRRIEFVATTTGTWDCDDEGGVIIGTCNAPQPMDGWDGTDFKWAKADVGAFQGYNYRNSNPAAPFPYNMEDYTAPAYNCWRWVDG